MARDHRKDRKQELHRINRRIKAREVRVIGSDGNQLGIMSLSKALELAEEQGLDLVEVGPNAKPPVCKIMDYGKYKYNLKKKQQESRKKQAKVVIKEIKIRPKTDKHDLEIKLRQAEKFLEDGAKVKFTMMFRGREIVYSNQGLQTLLDIANEFKEKGLAVIEAHPKLEGRNMSLILAPEKQKNRR